MKGRSAAWASLVRAAAASTALLVGPTVTRTAATPGPAGPPPTTVVTHHTLLEHEGTGVLAVLAVPVAVAASGVAGRRPLRVAAAVLLSAFSLLGLASIGLFHLPAALAMTLAAFSGAWTTD